MPINPKYLAQFSPGKYYHIYNRSPSQKIMFINHDNYLFFLQQLKKYLSGYLNFFAYCLFPNHFHLFVQVKDCDERTNDINAIISNQFKKMFIAYSNAFNKMHNMHGGIFQTPFRRILVDDEDYFSAIIYYIHYNPQHHNINIALEDYLYCSYPGFTSDKPTLLEREGVLKWFGGKEAFIKYHKMQYNGYFGNDFLIE